VGILLGAVCVALVAAGVQLWNVHQMTSDWVFWPKAIPSKVQFAGRDYQCGPNPVPSTRSLDGLTRQGTTDGGADIFAADPGSRRGTATWIVAKTEDEASTCDLMGSP
jgi:hypothetical protein